MRAVVTGGAGFIGSHLAEALLTEGHEVVVLDALDAPGRPDVRANAQRLRDRGASVLEVDLRRARLEPLVEGADVVHHLAARPGVRSSWAEAGEVTSRNVAATQRLLEAVATTEVPRLVLASSSSVYGDAPRTPTAEDDPLAPISPYAVSKRAVEDLARAYAAERGVASVVLRYFTVYGPRQRPDMALHRLCHAALTGAAFPLLGDGSARRDVTFVDDVVAATMAAGVVDVAPATPINVAGGHVVRLSDLVERVRVLTGRPVALDRRPASRGDVGRTGADTARAEALLGVRARVGVDEGLACQLAWHRRSLAGTERRSA